jgi:hypothetical protein
MGKTLKTGCTASNYNASDVMATLPQMMGFFPPYLLPVILGIVQTAVSIA